MKRPVGIVLMSILQFLGSILVLLMAVAMFVVPHFASQASSSSPEAPSGLFLEMGTVCLTFSAIGIATAVGVLRLKQWARISTLIFGGVLVFSGLVNAAFFGFVPLPDATMQTRLGFASVFGMAAALGGWWLYYFNRAAVKERFARPMGVAIAPASGAGEAQRQVPTSIAVIACMSLVGAASMVLSAASRVPAMVFPIVLTGKAAVAFYSAFALLHGYIGIGLLKLWSSARYLAVGLLTCGLLACTSCLLFPARYGRAIAQQAGAAAINAVLLSRILAIVLIFSLASSLLMLYFLITRKAAFDRGSAPPV